MPSIHVKKRQVGAKIVYYGPGLSGKSANLRFICNNIEQENRGKLIALTVTGADGLYIDVLPVRFGKVKGFGVTYNLCTVPGQAMCNTARRLVLKGADGVVFVADSRKNRMAANLDSLENLQENLERNDLSLEHVPHVIQYNWRNAPDALPLAELRATLNHHGVLEFEANAVSGEGVMDTLEAIVDIVRNDIEERL
jgi:hypothetical protein